MDTVNNNHFSQKKISDFIAELASKAPVPGGGGASALIGAVGMALGNMVGSLTIGKTKYKDVQKDIEELKLKADIIQEKLLALIDEDAKAFLPLSQAYGLPSNTDDEKEKKAAVMETALDQCCQVPLKIMSICAEAVELQKEFAQKGSKLAISDAGVGAACCKAAIQSAALNVYINTASMRDHEKATAYNARTESILNKYVSMADEVYAEVTKQLKKE